MKRGYFFTWFVIFALLFLNSVFAEQSSIDSFFRIAGCKTNSEYLPSLSCSRYGTFWCDSEGKLWNVFGDKGKCAGRDSSFKTIDDCCPSNYLCDDVEQICIPRQYSCLSLKNKKDCEDNGCIWWTEEFPEKCLSKEQLISCSDYKSNNSCTRDVFGLGKTAGIGTNVCSGLYLGTNLVLINSCRCRWIGTSETLGNCSLTYNILSDDPDQNKLFMCNKLFSIDNCVSNKQNLSWIVLPESFGLELSKQELEIFGCINGSKIINCGQYSIKLPFFDFFQLFVCLSFIFLGYFIYAKRRKT